MLERDAEFGVPQWRFGSSTYAFMSADRLLYSCVRDGVWRVGGLDIKMRQATDYPGTFASVAWLRASAASAVLRVSTADSPPAICFLDPATGAITTLKASLPAASYQPFKPYFSTPQQISFLVFQDEDHGFRQVSHIRRALEAELQFYAMNLVRARLTS